MPINMKMVIADTFISLARQRSIDKITVKALILKLMGAQKREQIEKLLVQAVRSYFQALIQSKNRDLPMNYSDMEFALDMWAFGITGMMLKCCVLEHVEPEKMAAQICRLLPDKLKSE